MKRKLKNIGFVIGVLVFALSGCKDDIDPLIEEIQYERVFSPINLEVKIRNQVVAEIDWTVRNDADYYKLEFSEDSLEFASIVKTVTVDADSVPVSVQLDGETGYSVRVKGVNESGQEDSKWSAIAFHTDPENIFETLPAEDIGATSVTLKWPAGSEVTHFLISPGNTQRDITAEEKAAGVATITGLTGETEYTIVLYKNDKHRGSVTFTTLVDIGDATAVYPEDDLNEIITNARDGDKFALFPGDYTVYTGAIVINRSISIKGIYPYNKPIVHAQFEIEDGAINVEISTLEMEGSYTDTEGKSGTLGYAIRFNSDDAIYGNLTVTGCYIHNYTKSLVITNTSYACTVESILVDDCIVADVYTDGGDFIDFRKSYVASLTVTNSTFYNCATENTRDFIRMDGSTKGNVYDDGTRAPEVEVNHCTLYNVMNSQTSMKRMFYIRWSQHSIKSKSNMLVNLGISVYSNQSLTLQPVCSNNNYFNANGYITEENNIKIDNSGDYTTLDPGFTDPDNSDFTVTNQSLIDNGVGDPRWMSGQ